MISEMHCTTCTFFLVSSRFKPKKMNRNNIDTMPLNEFCNLKIPLFSISIRTFKKKIKAKLPPEKKIFVEARCAKNNIKI
jgi:hypothetical protein